MRKKRLGARETLLRMMREVYRVELNTGTQRLIYTKYDQERVIHDLLLSRDVVYLDTEMVEIGCRIACRMLDEAKRGINVKKD